IARVVGTGATTAAVRIDTGVLLRLTRAPLAGDTELFLNSLRGVGTGAGVDLTFRSVADGSQVLQVNANAFNEQAGTVTVAALSAADAAALRPAAVYAEVAGVA